MGIYIPGIDMPLACAPCPAKYWCGLWSKVTLPAHIRHPDCPLVEVPEHGRLVDADAFAAEMKERQNEAGKLLRDAKDHDTAVRADAILSFLSEVKLTLDKLPTVIPEEET